MDAITKTEAIEIIIAAATDQPVIFTTGYTCRIARHIADKPNHFYMTGSMGLAAVIGLGVAECSKRTVVVVDGDGSLMMNPAALIEAGRQPGTSLLHFVLDDAIYASTGGQKSNSRWLDFKSMAYASGYSIAETMVSKDDLRQKTAGLLSRASETALIHCRIAPEATIAAPRIDIAPHLNAQRFMSFLDSTDVK
jgi:sulfopyruvate decarboxylase subunit beta